MRRADVSFFDRFGKGGLFGKRREAAALARRAELEGDLPRAARLWAEAERPDEAARVTLLRGDGELESGKRLQHYVQAVALAPEGHAVRDIARRKRALLVLAIAREGATSAAARLDLIDACKELEALGEATHAAEGYALVGDVEGEARALVLGGEIDRLEVVLDLDRDRARTARDREKGHAEIERFLANGQRREALARADELATAPREDPSATERAKAIRAKRLVGPSVTIELRGRPLRLLLGDEIVIGRSEGTIVVPSPAISRRHLVLARGAQGITARDLESRNGTELRGMRIGGAIPVPTDGELELKLGGEVPLRLSASDELPGALAIEVGGARYVAPLGPARIGIGEWSLAPAADGWLELVTSDDPVAYLGELRLDACTPLLSGDAIAAGRGTEVVLRAL
jgi:hypothetical protein